MRRIAGASQTRTSQITSNNEEDKYNSFTQNIDRIKNTEVLENQMTIEKIKPRRVRRTPIDFSSVLAEVKEIEY